MKRKHSSGITINAKASKCHDTRINRRRGQGTDDRIVLHTPPGLAIRRMGKYVERKPLPREIRRTKEEIHAKETSKSAFDRLG